MAMIPTVTDGKLNISIDVDKETLRACPLSQSGETRLLSGGGATTTISVEGVPVQLRVLAYFPADEIFAGVTGPEKVIEALERQCEAFGALGKKTNPTKEAKAAAKLEAFQAKLAAAKK